MAILCLLLTLACGSGGGSSTAAAPAPAAAVLASYNPVSGPAGTLVTIQGTGFTGVTQVRFGALDAPTFQVVGDTLIKVRVPAGSTPGPISVVAPGGAPVFPAPFTVVPTPPQAQLPVVTGFTPAGAPPGTEVTITGSGFTGVTQVDFGGYAAQTLWEDSDSQIRATVPADAGTGPITVVTLGGAAPSAAVFVVRPVPVPSSVPPVVTGFAPPSGAPGSQVTVAGTGFTGATQVNFAARAAQAFQVVNDTSLVATVPLGAASGPISVVAPAGTGASAGNFTVLAPAPTPAVAGFTPAAGPVGTVVTITGNGFTGATQVDFAGVAAGAFQVDSDAQITATVPAGAGTGPITIVLPGGNCVSAPFTVSAPQPPPPGLPAVAGFAPASGPVGATVILTGTSFSGATQVDFGGTAATSFLFNSDTTLTVVVPPGAVTGNLTVVTAVGSGVSAGVFTVTTPVPPPGAPTFTPASGPAGTVVTLTGTGFTGTTQVDFGGHAAQVFNVVDDTTLTATVPPNAVTGPVTVVTPGGAAASVGVFTVIQPLVLLTVSGFTPAAGPVGTPVVLTGARMDQAIGVTFGAVAAPAFHVDNDGQITVPVPPGAVTGNLVIQTAGGPVPVPGGSFTVVPARPMVLAYNPVQGVPGTEVVLTGSHFTGATQVTYGGTALAANRYDLDSDTSIRLRVPDDAAANAVIGVVTPGGADDSHTPFTVLPSRSASFTQLLVGVDSILTGNSMLDFPAFRRTDQYQFLQYPQAPIFHAYNPISVPPNLPANPYATFTLNFQLPAPYYEAIPQAIKDQIAALHVLPANVDLLCVSQDYAYDGVVPADGIYLFRPHYWTDPLAPNFGIYNVTSNVGVRIFQQEPGIAFTGHGADDSFYDAITVHSESNTVASLVVSSAQQFPMSGFDITRSTAFWSLVQLNNRVAVTLHVFLNDADQQALSAIAPTVQNFRQLTAALAASPLGATRGVAMLASFTRPIIHNVSRSPLPGTANDLLTLTGTALAGTGAVTLGGVPVLQTVAVSDAILKVSVPSGTAGDLVVTTPMGVSTPTSVP